MGLVRIPDFFKHYYRETLAFFMLIQLLATTLAAAFAWLLWEYAGYDPLLAFSISLVMLLIIQLVWVPVLVRVASKPLEVLAQAIAHVSRDPIQTAPPDLHHKGYQRSGLQAMVQTVYELAASGPSNTPENKHPTNNSVFETIINNVACGIIALNPKGQVVYANAQAPTHLDASNQRVIDLLFEQNDTLQAWIVTSQTNKVRDTKVWHRVADRSPEQEGRRIFDIIGYYAKNDQQDIETLLVTIDRTAEYSPDDDNMDFIALAAHELRGPITVIRGYLDILDQELSPELQVDQRQVIDRLQVSAERLSGYINNILNVSRYDRNHLTLHLHEEKLLDIIKNLVPDLALRAKTQNRRLSFHVAEDLPTIAADRSSLSEVFSNLIDNAIKYSNEGGEVIVAANAQGNFVEITVQDLGIGMPESVVGNLFNKFYRSHRSRQQVSGTGLGLYICKAIVQSHGGTIWVRSKEGQGTTFGFTVPIYSSVADKLSAGDNGNEQIIERSDGWIKNHAMYRR